VICFLPADIDRPSVCACDCCWHLGGAYIANCRVQSAVRAWLSQQASCPKQNEPKIRWFGNDKQLQLPPCVYSGMLHGILLLICRLYDTSSSGLRQWTYASFKRPTFFLSYRNRTSCRTDAHNHLHSLSAESFTVTQTANLLTYFTGARSQ